MDEDEELLQDFLVEAGEILEQLSEQLVELENRPQDTDLLNAVFRGFHTIKGGASFLNLDSLVALCHRSEDVFNALRNGERHVDAHVMDVILPVLDVLHEQFDELRNGQTPHHADPALLKQLDDLLASPQASQESQVTQTASQVNTTQDTVQQQDSSASESSESDEISDAEFEALLDSLEGKKPDNAMALSSGESTSAPSNAAPATEDGDEISEAEFDALLDQLHGKKGDPSKVSKNAPTAAPQNDSNADSENITEAEFDNLLDSLHGPGKSATGNARNSDDATNKIIRESRDSAPTAANSAVESKSSVKQRDSAPQAESTVRVDTKRLDDIMNMVGELVLVRNRLSTLEATNNDDDLSKVVANLDVVTADLQTAVMKTRMQPIKKVFGRFPRVVRDLARSLKKEVNLEMQGEDTDLDKNLVEALADPLVHLVRNAVDHGIEMPEDRLKSDKPRAGTVILTAEQEGDHILLTIEDDGKGMNADSLRQTAVRKGLLDEESAARLEPKDCYNLIFQPGFSTKTEISDVSGRGVGMDVVKTRIVQLNGTVEIDSKFGRGSVIIIKVPLTLAIMPTLMVMLESQIFALPLASVNEIFHLDLTKTNVVDGQLVVMVRDKALPLFYLRHWLVRGAFGDPLPSEGHVVVVSMGVQRIGFVVDTLIGQEEVVIKPLGALLHGMKGLAGATITGDGRISLILDIPGLMQTYARRL